uniref:Uncharacterized protein n=1 Tax=Graphocephala atropunctata TaxID=36148 RepID=A0A1B6LW38_9HEMI
MSTSASRRGNIMILAVVLGLFAWTSAQTTDLDLKLDTETIMDLDEAMFKDVTKPDPAMKKVIMNNMLNLFLSLDQIFEKLQEGGKIYDTLKKVVEEIKAKGGLKIVGLKQDDASVMKVYDWDEDRATQLRRNLERTCEMWKNIVELVDTAKVD